MEPITKVIIISWVVTVAICFIDRDILNDHIENTFPRLWRLFALSAAALCVLTIINVCMFVWNY